ncbi:hypothetical protein EV175_005479 [Coemansia sp. RSA 1933]|nr:hypothetical protein EV175_005479 [Coemansia sp. RSA 1933]
MDIDLPEARVTPTAAVAAVPATPPQSNNNTPQRDAGPNSSSTGRGGATSQRLTAQRQADSAVPESPHLRAAAGTDEDAFGEDDGADASARTRAARALDIRNQRMASRHRGKGRGMASSEFMSDLDDTQNINHTNFFNSFGADWDDPK